MHFYSTFTSWHLWTLFILSILAKDYIFLVSFTLFFLFYSYSFVSCCCYICLSSDLLQIKASWHFLMQPSSVLFLLFSLYSLFSLLQTHFSLKPFHKGIKQHVKKLSPFFPLSCYLYKKLWFLFNFKQREKRRVSSTFICLIKILWW